MTARRLLRISLIGLGLAFFFLFFVYPLLVMIYKVITPDQQLSLQYLSGIVSHSGFVKAFANTFLVSSLIAVVCLFVALPIAWLLVRTNIPLAKKWRSWFCLPYAIPPYIGAIAWIYLANPSSGLLNQWMGSFFDIYTLTGLVWVESTFLYTFILLSLLTALDRMDPSLEEAARLSGAGAFQVFWYITLPLIRPAMVSGVLLVILAAAASFGVPSLIGSPAKIYLVTTQIYTFQKMGSMKGLYQASAMAIYLLMLSSLLLFISKWILNKKSYQVVGGKSSRVSLIDLGRYKYPLTGLLFLIFFILFILPLSGLAITAFNQVQGSLEIKNFGFGNFKRVFFEMDETPRALGHSLYLALIAASLCCVMASILSFVKLKTQFYGRNFFEFSSSLSYSIPGTILALALILTFSRGILGFGPSLYNTFALIWLAYSIKYLSLAQRTISDGLGQIDHNLAEAARVSGANIWQTIRFVWVPLLKPSIMASWFLIFMPAFSELTMTIMLSGPGLETLGTLIFQLQEYADPSGGAAAVLALVVVGFVLTVNQTLRWVSGNRYGL